MPKINSWCMIDCTFQINITWFLWLLLFMAIQTNLPILPLKLSIYCNNSSSHWAWLCKHVTIASLTIVLKKHHRNNTMVCFLEYHRTGHVSTRHWVSEATPKITLLWKAQNSKRELGHKYEIWQNYFCLKYKSAAGNPYLASKNDQGLGRGTHLWRYYLCDKPYTVM